VSCAKLKEKKIVLLGKTGFFSSLLKEEYNMFVRADLCLLLLVNS
jgi:hypothetical protein